MYCLKVIITHPDYERPYTTVIVEHFKTEYQAHMRLRDLKLEYIKNYDITKDENHEELVLVDEFDKLLKTDRVLNYIYNDSFVYQLPFEWQIFKVEID